MQRGGRLIHADPHRRKQRLHTRARKRHHHSPGGAQASKLSKFLCKSHAQIFSTHTKVKKKIVERPMMRQRRRRRQRLQDDDDVDVASAGAEHGQRSGGETVLWTQCDACSQWRSVPARVTARRWTCAQHAAWRGLTCAVPEESHAQPIYSSEEGEGEGRKRARPPPENDPRPGTAALMVDAILLEIFSYLSVVTLCRAAQVCRLWRRLAQSARLWRLVAFGTPTLATRMPAMVARLHPVWHLDLRNVTFAHHPVFDKEEEEKKEKKIK